MDLWKYLIYFWYEQHNCVYCGKKFYMKRENFWNPNDENNLTCSTGCVLNLYSSKNKY
jgi:hypothetical protein